jgi:predicted Zn-dependent peptidase
MALNQTYRYGERFVPIRGQALKYTNDDIHRFHDQFYRPDDMILVVIGNIKTADVEALVRKYFEGVPRRPESAKPAAALTKSMAATWDIDAETLYLIAPGPYSDRERLVLTMFGLFLHQSMNTTQEVYGACRALYCSNQVYRVGDLPFFVFAEPAEGRTVPEVAGILSNHLERALTMLDDDALVGNIKGSLITFVTASMLKPDVPDYPMAHHQVIGQEALNVGMKHLLREGKSVEEFTNDVNSVTPDELRSVVRKHLARDKMLQVTFKPRT